MEARAPTSIAAPPTASLCSSVSRLYTPAHRKRKLIDASVHRHGIRRGIQGQDVSYEGLLNKTWRAHSLSPLYKFKSNPTLFKQYARSLDVTFTQTQTTCGMEADSGMISAFEIYHGLNFHDDDQRAVRIQVTQRDATGHSTPVVLTAILVCVDVESSPVPPHLSHLFAHFPVIMICGTKPRGRILLEWLERRFDCRSFPLTFSNSDLRWMLAAGSSQVGSNKADILLRYDVSQICQGIRHVDAKFESQFCKELWDRLHKDSPSQNIMTESQVNEFVSALENHLEYSMHIFFSKLKLAEVGTPMAYVSKEGKFKMFSNSSVYLTLHFICDMANGKFTQS